MFTALLIAAVACPLRAARVEILARSNGERVPHARACFSKGVDGIGTRERILSTTLLERMVSGADVRCLSADQVLNIPGGTWHLTVETDREVSWHPFVVTVGGRGGEDTPINRITCALQAGATLDLAAVHEGLLPGQRIVIYAAPTKTSRSAIVPARQPAMIVPANVPVTPMIMGDSGIVAVGRSEWLEAGRRGVASFSALSKAMKTVVVPFVVKAEPDDAIEGSLQVVHAKSREVVLSFDLPERGIDGLLIVPGIAPGAYEVVVRSETWTAEAARIDVQSVGGPVLLTADLEITKRPELEVDWSIDSEFRVTSFREPECDDATGESERGATRPVSTLTAWRCPVDVRIPSKARTRACEALHKIDLPDEDAGKVTWPSPGETGLWIELQANGQSAYARADSGRDGSLGVSVRLEPPRINGRVTLGDDSAHGIVKCGSGTAAITDPATGQYQCWYRVKDPKRDFFGVSLCDGSEEYVHVVENPQSVSVVDIAIPDNSVSVRVLDAADGDGLEGAAVWLQPANSEGNLELLLRDLGRTPKGGRLATKRVPLMDWSACATKEGYEKHCTDLNPPRNGEIRVEITLHDTTVVRGRVLSSGPMIDRGTVHVVDGAAHELERAPVAADGTFHLRRDVVLREVRFVLTSRSHPLLLLDVDRFERPLLDLRPPRCAERSFVVSSSNERGPLTVAIGDTVIPVNAFLLQQSLHGQQYYVQPDRPVNVAPIGESSEITVIFGVVPEGVSDPFGVSHLLAMMPKQTVLPGVSRISF